METPVFICASKIGIFIKITYLSALRQNYILVQKMGVLFYVIHYYTMYKFYIQIYSFIFIVLFAVHVMVMTIFPCYCILDED